jgi:hypothetical protein
VRLLSLGYGDIAAKNPVEAVWMTVAMCVGSGLYAYAVGEVCGILANLDAASKAYMQQSDLLVRTGIGLLLP